MFLRYPLFLLESEPEDFGGGGDRRGDIELGSPTASLDAGDPPAAKQDDPPAAKQDDPPAAKQDEPPAAAKWDMGKLLSSIGFDFKEGDERFNQFKPVKDFTAKVMEANKAQALELVEKSSTLQAMEAKLAEMEKNKGTSKAAEPADVAALRSQLDSLQTKYTTELKEFEDIKAKSTLEGHPAFRREFEAKQAHLFSNAKETAEAIKLPQEKLDEIFTHRGELGIRKAIEAAGIEDPTAKQIITEKALGWDALQKQREDLLAGKVSGKRPSELLAEYEAMQAEFGVHLTQAFTKDLSGKLILATDKAPAALAESSPFFKTEQGKLLAAELKMELQQGKIFSADEAVQHALLARTAPVWEKMAMEFKTKSDALEKQVAALTGALPGSHNAGGGGTSKPAQSFPEIDATQREGDIVLTR